MIRLRSLLSVAQLAALGVVLAASTAQADLKSFLDPSTYFGPQKDSHEIQLMSGGRDPFPAQEFHSAPPAGYGYQNGSAPASLAPPCSQDGFCAPPRSVSHWLPGDGARACAELDPYRDGWYLGISGGTSYRERVHEIPDITTFIDLEMGFSASAFLGYRFHRFRLEAAGTYIDNEVKTAGSGGLLSNATGNISLRSLMFNGYHDFKISDWKLSPYLGAGIGVYQSQLNSMYPAFFQLVDPDFAVQPVNSTSNVPMAWQVMTGVTYPIGDRTEFFAGYRYFRGDTLTFASIPFAAPSAPFFNPNGAICHNVELGLRVKF